MTTVDTEVERLTRLNAELLDALIAVHALIDDGDIFRFSPATIAVAGHPPQRQLERFRHVNALVSAAIRHGTRAVPA
jgi:hypothetical protein